MKGMDYPVLHSVCKVQWNVSKVAPLCKTLLKPVFITPEFRASATRLGNAEHYYIHQIESMVLFNKYEPFWVCYCHFHG